MSTFGDISILQIEVFLSVAECKSITTASRKLFISQSSASRLMQKLEECVNAPLFQRDNRGVELTESGEQLYRQLKQLHSRLNAAFYNVRQTRADSGNPVRLACLDATETFEEVSPLIKQFNNTYPDIPVDVKVCRFHDLREGMISGKYDCAITYSVSCHGLPEDMERRYYKHMDTYFAVSADNIAIEGDRLNYQLLSKSNLFIHLSAQYDLSGKRGLSICRSHGFTPMGIQYFSDATAIEGMVLDANGFAIAGKAFGIDHGNAIRVFKAEVPLEEEQYIVLLWRPDDASSEARRFVESVPYLQVDRLGT